MAKKIKPVTPGLRFRIAPIFDEITSSNPEKSLLKTLKKSGGRNKKGRMTSRYMGGGHKKRYRKIDFKREKFANKKFIKKDKFRKKHSYYSKEKKYNLDNKKSANY